MDFDIKEVKWRVYRGLAGDPHTLLTANYKGIEFNRLFLEKSPFNISRKLAERKILKAIGMLGIKHHEGYERVVVCSAIRNRDGLVICGPRHWDLIMHAQAEASGAENWEMGVEQGFVDNKGNFITREEAWLIAKRACQVIKRVGGNELSKLYSENLF